MYDKHVYPIVEQTMAGKSVGIIANSIPNNDFTSYLATPDDGHSASLIVSIVAQLLKPINNHAGSVAFSWYKIGCDKDETITDVLRCASAAAASDPKAAEAASHLSLREVGRGRGMTVSGLWEVELASAADIEAIISHVLQMYPAGDSLSASHSVFQFVYTPREAKGTAAAKSILSNDSPGVGRFSFITLSCISSYDFNTLALARVARHPLHAYEHDWVQKLTHIVEWITSGRPSPPYHKSRLVLLLRDILCSRQSCLTLLCVDKFSSTNATQQMGTGSNTSVVSENDIVAMYYEQIHKWFQIMSCVSYARDPKRKTSNVRSLDLAKSSTQGTNTHQSSDKKNTPGKDILANNRRSSRSAPGGRTVLNSNRNDRSTPTPAVGGTNSRSSSANPRERQVAQAVKSEKSDTGSAGCNSSSNINPKEEHVVIRDNLMKKLNNDAPALPMTEASPPPPPPPVHTTTNTLNHVNTNGLGEIFPEIPYQEEYADIIPEVKPSAVPIAGRRKSVVADSKLHFHGSGHSHGIASGHGHAGGVESNGNAHDREVCRIL